MRRLSVQAGFTLIEIMIVVVILGVLAALVVPKIMSRPDQARHTAAKADIKSIGLALNMFRADNGFYPTSAEGLASLVQAPPRAKRFNPEGYLSKVPVDPWGNEYRYVGDGGRNFVIISLGADGVEGGEAYDEDIDSRALD
jgi:general secretion pathway protein G